MKRLISFFMALAIVFTSAFAGFPLTEVAAQAASSMTVNDAVAWIKARADESWWRDVDGSYGCQCVDLIYAYYEALGYSRLGGNACDYASSGSFGIPSGSGWYKDNTPSPGAIIAWPGNTWTGQYTTSWAGHVGLVYAVSGSNVYTVETNLTSPYNGTKGEANAKYCTRTPQNAVYIHPSFSGTHTHNYQFKYFLEAHPHRDYYECSCGDGYVDNESYRYYSEKGCKSCTTFETVATGTYLIRNKATRQYLTLENNTDANKTNIKTSALISGDNKAQQFVIYSAPTGYKIRPVSSARVINPFGDSGVTTNGMNVNLYDDVNDNTQWWQFRKADGGYYIHNVANLSCALNSSNYNAVVSTVHQGHDYMIWELVSVNQKYTIAYNANGGSGTMANTEMTVGTAANLRANTFTRTGYTFLGWSTSASATTAMYTDKQSVKDLAKSGTVTLYAVWRDDTTHPDSMGYNATSTSITQFWTPVQTADSITVTIKLDNVTLKSVTLPSSSTSYTFTDLKPGTKYEIQIMADYDNVSKGISSYVTTIPPSVSNFNGTSTTNSVNLTWNKSSGATIYKLQQQINDTWQTIASPTGTSYTVSGLKSGTAYNFRIFARNSAGQSAQTKLTISTAIGTPTAVTGFTGAPTSNSITLKWNKSTGATEYKLQQSVNGAWQTIASPTGTTYTVSGLKANTTYNFRIFARKGSAQSAQTKLTVTTKDRIAAVSGFTGTPTANSILLKWHHMGVSTSFKLQQNINGAWQTIAEPTGSSYNVTGLQANTTYNFRIFARYGSLQSDQTKLTVSTTAAVPSTVTSFMGTATANSITLKWNKSAGATSYKLQQNVNGAWTTIASPTGTTYTVTGLKANTQYNFRIFPRNNVGQGAQTKLTVSTVGTPETVMGFMGVASSNSITLKWYESANATEYKLQQMINGGWQTIATPTGTSFTVKNLSANTAYNFRIFARNGSLQSDQVKLTVKTS